MFATSFSARWITWSRHPGDDIGVFAFRARWTIDEPLSQFPVRVSADQRYKLFVGDRLVAFGPQRGDLEHWFYDTVDLAPHLNVGENVVWALVLNFGYLAPPSQISLRTAFLLDAPVAEFDTGARWQACRLDAWTFDRTNHGLRNFYVDAGPEETVDGAVLPDFRSVGTADALPWRPVNAFMDARVVGSRWESQWALMSRSIPAMEYREREASPARVVRRSGPDGPEVIYDLGELVCAYPRIVLRGPAGSRVRLRYDEGLWRDAQSVGAYGAQPTKGHRAEIDGRHSRGYFDTVQLGEAPVVFEPLWWRTFRYLVVQAPESAICDLQVFETGYPYVVQSSFVADDASVAPLWDVSVRTAKLCAGETYFDCPYYEQLQYVGDTRIQVLLHYYLSRDRALARNAIEQFAWSIKDNGLTQSRYPNRATQFIPAFSLWWVMMLYDQMLFDDVRPHGVAFSTVQRVLDAFAEKASDPSQPQHWGFFDWVPGWGYGIPPGGLASLPHSLLHRLASVAGELLRRHWSGEDGGEIDFSLWRTAGLPAADPQSGLLRGTSGEASEHAETLARLACWHAGDPIGAWPATALAAHGAAKASLYFQYYRHLAQAPADYLGELGPWRTMIENGLTTFAETEEPTRSDCHAWSAHPALGFFQHVAGIGSIAPGWSRVRIAPRPGKMARFEARLAHPQGDLKVSFHEGRLIVVSPVPAQVVWRSSTASLPAGRHEFAG